MKLVPFIVAASFFAFPAFAIDCANKPLGIDKLICASPELKKADDAMSAAYFKLLRDTTDPEFHEALIRSQRRWLKVRSGGAERYGAAEDDKTDDSQILLQLTQDRLAFLQEKQPINNMEQQRKIALMASGGPFAGYRIDCSIVPPPYGGWGYECWGDMQQQSGDRVCSVVTDWASGHTTDYRLVSIIKNGELKPMASCSTGYAATTESCPDELLDGDGQHWNTDPHLSDDSFMPKTKNLWKYDPDVKDVLDDDWMSHCLRDRIYPPPEVSRADPAPKK